jgi:hypothetical protein
MAIRVLRLMEYIYPDLEVAHNDMARWHVQGVMYLGEDRLITSTVILQPTSFEFVLVQEVASEPEQP